MSARRYRPRDVGWAALFLAPSLAVFAVFVIYPLGRTFLFNLSDPFPLRSDGSRFDAPLG